EYYRSIGDLNYLGEILEKHNDQLQLAVKAPLVGSGYLDTAAKLKLDAIRSFNNLSPQAKGAICQRIYELDNGGNGDSNYGYNKAIEDLGRILLYKNECLIRRAINQSYLPTAPRFIVTYKHEESMRPTDSPQTIQEIRKLYEFEDLKQFLTDRYK